MAELDKPDRAAEEEETAQQQPSKRRKPGRLLARLLEPKWLLVLLAVSITGHAIGFTYYRAVAGRSADDPGREVSLGEFRFVADPAEGSGIGTADFALHLALLEQVEGAARRELSAKRFRVQQAVEELIRRAHGPDAAVAGADQRGLGHPRDRRRDHHGPEAGAERRADREDRRHGGR